MAVKVEQVAAGAGHVANGSVVVYGPQGCGKSLHSDALRRALNCVSVVDDWWPGDKRPARALLLTHIEMEGGISFQDAMKLVKGGPARSAAQIEREEQAQLYQKRGGKYE